MTIDEIQSALKFDMDMMLFDANTGEVYPKESLKYGNEMNYIHYCANEEAIKLLDELKELRKMREDIESNANALENNGYNKAIEDFACYVKHEDAEGNIKTLDDYDRIAEQLKEGVKNE